MSDHSRKPGTADLPPLSGRRTRLQPVRVSDYDFLYDLEAQLQFWRFHGSTPSPEAFVQSLWSGVLANFIVASASGDAVGLVTAYSPDQANGHALIAVAAHPSQPPGSLAEGIVLFVNYCFSTWPLRKLYAEAVEYNLHSFRTVADRYCVEEGRLRDHYFLQGRYWDKVTLALYREAWDAVSADLIRHTQPLTRH